MKIITAADIQRSDSSSRIKGGMRKSKSRTSRKSERRKRRSKRRRHGNYSHHLSYLLLYLLSLQFADEYVLVETGGGERVRGSDNMGAVWIQGLGIKQECGELSDKNVSY